MPSGLDPQGLWILIGLAVFFYIARRMSDFHVDLPPELRNREPEPEPDRDRPPRRVLTAGDDCGGARGSLGEAGCGCDGCPPVPPGAPTGATPWELEAATEEEDAAAEADPVAEEFAANADAADTLILPDAPAATPFERGLLAWCYVNGIDVPFDVEELTVWIEEEAGDGLPEAQFALGVCHHYGDGVPKSPKEARRLLRLAAVEIPDAGARLQQWYGEAPPEPRPGARKA